ncbi:uncharacterized protein LOC142219899 [Haematobia irritans]|uniref:uncharacterized protein LOC142219899 n=1 Tax=Haematobia irritans TaxID=7368 RepID=UPI003F508040
MTFNSSQINGTWWGHNPLPIGNGDCIEVEFIEEPGNNVLIRTTYSNTPSYLWVNQTMSATINLDNTNGDVNGLNNTSHTVYKLLDTDYQNYAFLCGYTNISDTNSTFGIALTRERYPNTTILNSFEMMANQKYADFTNGTMSLVSQSPTCYISNGAYGLYEYSIVVTLLGLLQALLHLVM